MEHSFEQETRVIRPQPRKRFITLIAEAKDNGVNVLINGWPSAVKSASIFGNPNVLSKLYNLLS